MKSKQRRAAKKPSCQETLNLQVLSEVDVRKVQDSERSHAVQNDVQTKSLSTMMQQVTHAPLAPGIWTKDHDDEQRWAETKILKKKLQTINEGIVVDSSLQAAAAKQQREMLQNVVQRVNRKARLEEQMRGSKIDFAKFANTKCWTKSPLPGDWSGHAIFNEHKIEHTSNMLAAAVFVVKQPYDLAKCHRWTWAAILNGCLVLNEQYFDADASTLALKFKPAKALQLIAYISPAFRTEHDNISNLLDDLTGPGSKCKWKFKTKDQFKDAKSTKVALLTDDECTSDEFKVDKLKKFVFDADQFLVRLTRIEMSTAT